MYCIFELGYHHGGQYVSSICCSVVYHNMSAATKWPGGPHQDPRDKHTRILMELRSKELYETLSLDRPARDSIVEAVLKRAEEDRPPSAGDIIRITESVAPAQIRTLQGALDSAVPLDRANRWADATLKKYAVQLLLRTHHTAGKALTSRKRWPRCWVTVSSRTAGDGEAPAGRLAHLSLLRWRYQSGWWPERDTRLANWAKYHKLYSPEDERKRTSAPDQDAAKTSAGRHGPSGR